MKKQNDVLNVEFKDIEISNIGLKAMSERIIRDNSYTIGDKRPEDLMLSDIVDFVNKNGFVSFLKFRGLGKVTHDDIKKSVIEYLERNGSQNVYNKVREYIGRIIKLKDIMGSEQSVENIIESKRIRGANISKYDFDEVRLICCIETKTFSLDIEAVASNGFLIQEIMIPTSVIKKAASILKE